MKENIYSQMKSVETEKFILRQVKSSDAIDMHEYYKEDAVVKYLPFKAHKSIEETKRFINMFFIRNYREGRIGHLAIVSKENNKVIGNIGLNNVRISDKVGEIGICINPKWWGDNLATKLTTCILMYGFDYLNMEKLIAITYEDNKYTRKSLVNLGFKYIKTYDKKIKSNFVRCHVFEITNEDYIYNKLSKRYDRLITARIID